MDTSREASFIAVKLRRIADKFRQAANAGGEFRNLSLEEAAGGLIIRAWELRCLDGIDGLAHLVAWVKDPDPANNESIMVACPANLFIEFCGFHGHVVRQVGNALEIIPGEHIGLLPRLLPKTLPDLPDQDSPSKRNSLFQYYSEVCEWIADEIGKTNFTAGVVSESPKQAKSELANPTRSKSKGTIGYLSLKLDVARRRLSGPGVNSVTELDPVQAAVLRRLLESRDVWLHRIAIEAVISNAKTQPGQPPYKSEDPFSVQRMVSKLRASLAPFGRTVTNDRNSGYRIQISKRPTAKRPQKGGASRRKVIGKKSAS